MIESTFIHKCTIKRLVATGAKDASNLPVKSPSTIGSDLPCRLVERQRRWYENESADGADIGEYKLFLSDGVDIQNDDVITVTLEDGTVLTESFEVKRVMKRRALSMVHQSAELKVV